MTSIVNTALVSDGKKTASGAEKDRDRWSKSDEIWQRVNAILNAGVVARVNEKQMETRRYLEDVEERFVDIIKKAKIELEPESMDLPDTAAYLPSGNISLEIHNAIGAINLLNDKQLKFRLTTFVDDYRRILEMNREQEQQELLESLEEHFEKGSYDFVEQKEETEEMLESKCIVEAEAKKIMEMKEELVTKAKRLKHERDQALFYKATAAEEMVSLDMGTIDNTKPKAPMPPPPAIPTIPTPTKEDTLTVIFDILQRPRVLAVIGVEDFITLRQNIDLLANPRVVKKEEPPIPRKYNM